MLACWLAVMDAAKIDEINILQATLLGKRLVAETIMQQTQLATVSIVFCWKLTIPSTRKRLFRMRDAI
jgi:hypothetical protein